MGRGTDAGFIKIGSRVDLFFTYRNSNQRCAIKQWAGKPLLLQKHND
jgi:hypothetical protein